MTYYNLDVIISVGYRVKSQRGIEFRKWATKRLKEYLIKGYSITVELLSNGRFLTNEQADREMDEWLNK